MIEANNYKNTAKNTFDLISYINDLRAEYNSEINQIRQKYGPELQAALKELKSNMDQRE